ncbi:D-alanyl-D-alanine carboxypeptidase [Liquorilactobacillus sucicola DSM 21376 = JCM 15457]|uniref:serine-type D-Ala-D-Ala carboxypeptidase n=1 Tax=Liquorilactobacillus sucicola DSM 21376 = JCM 15457 TaxID=1423806 RepID=A0A023CXX8_9LACO|nr:serine hydrolase [Liquorilactobacillus sucicola]KRN06974.1 D-alanyl-d-alanine carboxypeptidase [Liquorilactobacillus sucicola DSM 21376 = JCM 15457]GAJ26456.1 D-alanyl-D-alanine carboxypeptidase [Liquorilactobacillus sucicola DSM 21376 = JCM 15457]
MLIFKKTKQLMLGLMIAVTTFASAASGIMLNESAKADTVSTDKTLQLDVKAAIAVDAKTGQIIYSKNSDQTLPVASMTKLLSIYLVMQAVKEGKLSWDQKVPVDDASFQVSQDTKMSNVPLKKDTKYTVRQLYQASLIYSANGAVMTLANAVAGSQQAFVNKMKQLLRSWNIKDAELYTTSGLGNDEIGSGKYPGAPAKAENKLSAKDMALISQKLLHDYPEVLKTTSIARMKFNNGTSETEMENWNWMLKGLAKSYSDLPVDGLKTGTSDSAGANFAGTVNKDGKRIITIVLGAKHDNDADTSRFEQTQKLMSYVYNNYTYTTIKAQTKFNGASKLPVYHGKKLTTPVATKNSTDVWLKRGSSASDLQAKLSGNKKLYKKRGLEAPLAKNRTVGTLKLNTKGQQLAYLNGDSRLELPAVNTQAVKKANVFVIMGRAIKNFFTNLF